MKSEVLKTLFQTLDPVEILRAHYEHRKIADAKFSYQSWADELGLKSRSFLRLVLRGERSLTADVGELFVAYFKMNKSQATYWRELVKLGQAKTLASRELACLNLNKLRSKFALKDHNFKELDPRDVYEYFANFKMPRLHTLLSYPNLDRNLSSLSQLLQISENETAQMLQTLTQLGLCKNEDNQFASTTFQLQRPDLLGNVALQSFHKKSLQEAIDAIDYPKNSRRFQSLLLALSEEEMEELSQELTQKLSEILARDENSKTDLKSKRLYQINLNLIPVSASYSRAVKADEIMTNAPTENKKEDQL